MGLLMVSGRSLKDSNVDRPGLHPDGSGRCPDGSGRRPDGSSRLLVGPLRRVVGLIYIADIYHWYIYPIYIPRYIWVSGSLSPQCAIALQLLSDIEGLCLLVPSIFTTLPNHVIAVDSVELFKSWLIITYIFHLSYSCSYLTIYLLFIFIVAK